MQESDLILPQYFIVLQAKCARYWPDGYDDTLTFGSISIVLLVTSCLEHYTVRTMEVKSVGIK